MGKKGFTLAEILVTVVILGILAGLAAPMYGSMIEGSRSNEAKASLSIILMAEKVYKLNSTGQVYWGAGGTTAAAINTGLNIELMPRFYDANWSMAQAGNGAGATFTARVERTGDATRWYSIDQAGTGDSWEGAWS